MIWTKLHDDAIQSGDYVVLRCRVNGKPWKFSAMKGRTNRQKNKFPKVLGYFDTSEEAKRFCDAHAAD